MSGQNNTLGRPVYNLQVMLRELSYYDRAIPRLVPDGRFGSETQTAVLRFQRGAGLPDTGRVDNATWDAVVLAYTRVQRELRVPMRTNGFPDRLYTVSPGENSVYMLMIQAMFNALLKVLDEVAYSVPDGLHDADSVQNIRWLQRLGSLDETGIMGKVEWDLLARIYEIFLIRAIDPDLIRP